VIVSTETLIKVQSGEELLDIIRVSVVLFVSVCGMQLQIGNYTLYSIVLSQYAHQ